MDYTMTTLLHSKQRHYAERVRAALMLCYMHGLCASIMQLIWRIVSY